MPPTKKRAITIIALLISLIAAAAAAAPGKIALTAQEREWLDAHREITVAIMSDWPPLNMVDQEGKPEGIGVDYLTAVQDKLGIAFRIVPGKFADNIEAVKEKRIDVLMDVTPKPDREVYLDFTKPYLTIPHLIVGRISDTEFNSEKDLTGKTIALERGFGNVKHFRENFPQVKVVEMNSTVDCLRAVSRGEADAYAGNSAVSSYIIAREVITNLRMGGGIATKGSILCLGVRKDWPLLAPIIDKALDSMGTSEKLAILRTWTAGNVKRPAEEKITLSPEEQKFIQSGKTLRYSEVPWEPLSVIDRNGRFDGIIADYLSLITKKTGLKMTFVPSPTWNEVIKKYTAREIEMVPSLSTSDEAGREIALSDSYISFPLVITTRDDVRNIEDVSLLNGKRVAVGRGYTSYHYMRKKHPGVELVEVDDVTEGLMALSQGKVFAFIDHFAVTVNYLQSLGMKNLKIAGEAGYNFEHRMGVDPAYPEALSIINKSLRAITEEERRAIYNKWLPVEPARKIDYKLVWKYVLIVTGISFFILATIIYWNRRLKKSIRERDEIQAKLRTNADEIKTSTERKIHIHEITSALREAETFENLGSVFLSAAIPLIKAEQGVLYVLDRDMELLTRVGSYAAGNEENAPKTFKTGQGLVGQCALTGETLEIKPDRDSGTFITWGAGQAVPAQINIVPVKQKGQVIGIVEIASLNEITRNQMEILSELLPALAMTIEVLERNLHTKELLQESLEQAKALEEQGRLLAETSREREEANISLSRQVDELDKARNTMISMMADLQKARIESEERNIITQSLLEEKSAQAALLNEQQLLIKEAEKWFKGIIESAPDGILVMEEDGTITLTNPEVETIFGYGPGQLIGQSVDTLIPLDVRKKHSSHVNSYFRRSPDQQTIQAMSVRGARLDGTEIPVEISLSILPGSTGRGRSVCASVRDISERKKMEEEIKTHIDELERFNRLTIDREERMIKLKEEVNRLLEKTGKQPKYKIVD